MIISKIYSFLKNVGLRENLQQENHQILIVKHAHLTQHFIRVKGFQKLINTIVLSKMKLINKYCETTHKNEYTF